MKFFTKHKNSLVVVAGLILTSVGAFAAGKKADSDDWSWRWVGSVEDAGHMFPNTEVHKFRDTSNGVVCYVYSAKNVTSVTFTTNGVSTNGVKGGELGTMSCVSERR